ncbi:MAG: HU family DNA-binding protein [Treponema sp.]|nr:HU family DNA-binding protein [Treponema sp.]
MTRQELLKKLSASTELNKKNCNAVITAVFEEIEKTLEKGGKYTQPGFGVFETTMYKERTVRNPFTKQQVLYPKKRKIRFKPSKVFKDKLNEK